MSQDKSGTKRLAKNTLMMYIRMGITMVVGLISARIVLQALGVEDFGLYNVVSGIVVLITFFNNSLTLATQRYMSYALGQDDIERLRNVFNASYIIYVVLAFFILIVGESVGLWFINNKMEFPEGKLPLANFVYQFTLIIMCLNVVKSSYNALFISYEKFDFYAYTAIVESIIHLIFVCLLLVDSINPSYTYIVFQTIAALIMIAWYHVYYKKHYGVQLPFHRVSDKALFKEILSFSGWGVLGSLAVIGFQQGVNILLNLFFGVTINAAFGIANRVSGMVNQFFSGFLSAANPQITKAHAVGDIQVQTNLINKTSKLSFLLLMVLGIILIYNVDFLLDIWLKDVPEYTSALCCLMIIGMMIDALSSPLYVTIYATGKVKYYQIVISIILLQNLLFSYFLFKMGYPVETCMYVRIILFIVAYIARLLFVKHYTSVNVKDIIKEVIVPLCIVSVIVLVVLFAIWHIEDPIVRLFYVTPFLLIFMLLVSYLIACNRNEKQMLVVYCKKLIKKELRRK